MPAQTYRKLIVKRFADTLRDSLAIVETSLRDPAPNEILVRNVFVGVNMSDVPMILGRRPLLPNPPFDIGMEAAGEVIAVGKNVHDFHEGDKVITMMFGNGFREYSALDSKLAMHVDELTPELMALLVSGTRASIALEVVARMSQGGMTVLVTGAASGSGHYAVQLAKLAGNRVIGTVGHDDEVAMLADLGCDRVINRSREDLHTVLQAEYPNGVNLVFESFGGKIFDVALDNLAPRGQLIIVDTFAEHTRQEDKLHTLDLYDKIIWKAATLHGFSLVEYAQFIRSHAKRMMDLRAAGKIRSILDPTPFEGLEGIIDALEYISAWKHRGKVSVKLS